MSNNESNKDSNKLSIIVGLILIALIIGYIFYCNYQPSIEPPPKLEQNNYEPLVSDLSYESESSLVSSTSSVNNSAEQLSASSL